MDQFISDIRYDCIVDCKQNDTKVANKINTIVSMETLASRLKSARDEAGLSQEELAAKVGMTRGGIGHLETGRRDGSTHLPKIADALGVNALWLAEGKGPKSAKSLQVVTEAIAEVNAAEDQAKRGHESALAAEIQARDIPDHIEQAIMALLSTCKLKPANQQPAEPRTNDLEAAFNKLLDSIPEDHLYQFIGFRDQFLLGGGRGVVSPVVYESGSAAPSQADDDQQNQSAAL